MVFAPASKKNLQTFTSFIFEEMLEQRVSSVGKKRATYSAKELEHPLL